MLQRSAGTDPLALPGLYLHVPFCSAVCPYCDFAVRPDGRARRARWLEGMLAEVELRAAAGELAGGPEGEAGFDTVYLGGGTPSLLAGEELARLLEAARGRLGARPDAWTALEANPEDVTPERARAWRALGVRTLSLGVQALDAASLAFLGRRHSPGEARAAVAAGREAGFDTLSIDLIYGLPGEGPAAWRARLEEAVALRPDHLSCYQLSMPEGTRFGRKLARGELVPLGDDSQAELFELTHALLADSGYDAYEVSSFAAAPAHRSRHNAKYWEHAPYLGLGPSAHSFRGSRRSWNERRLEAWLGALAAGRLPVAGSETLGARELALEAVMLGLRTAAGVDLARLRARFGVDLLAANAARLPRLEAEGLVALEKGSLRATRRGLAVADALAAALSLEA